MTDARHLLDVMDYISNEPFMLIIFSFSIGPAVHILISFRWVAAHEVDRKVEKMFFLFKRAYSFLKERILPAVSIW